MLLKKKTKKNINNEFLSSMAPTHEAKIDIYETFITNAIDEKIEKHKKNSKKINQNIAFTGIYGAGKSSAIKTYFSKHKKLKVLYVSLDSYIENKTNVKNEIELSVLQQIIYKGKPSKLPFSRINRIDKNKKKARIYSILFGMLLSLLIILINYLSNFDAWNDFFITPYKITILCIIVILFICVLSISIYYIFTKFKLKYINISGKNSEAKLERNNLEQDVSILNIYIDELINFFKNTRYEFVVFEDLDRLSEPLKLFSKLKEINNIINNAIDKKTIRFIYCIKDTIFKSSEERTKYFDIIIPILPYISYATSREALINEIRKYQNIKLENNELNLLGWFIPNQRYIIDIFNEYKILEKNSKSDTRSKKISDEEIKKESKEMLFLSAYKVLFPKRFDLLYANKGIISYYLSSNFVSDLKKSIDKDIEMLTKQLEDTKKRYNSYIIEQFNKVISRIKKSQKKNTNEIKFEILNKKGILAKNIIKDPNKIFLLEESTISVFLNKKEIKEGELFSSFENSKEVFFDKLKSNEIVNKINILKKEIYELKNKIAKYNNISNINREEKINLIKGTRLDENCEFYYSSAETKEDYNRLNNFELQLINYNLIGINTKKFINRRHYIILSENDDIILNNIIHNNPQDAKTSIDDSKKLLEQLSVEDFVLDSTCIIELYEEMLQNQKKDNYLDSIFLYLTERKLNFFKEYEQDSKKKYSLFENATKYFENIWKYIYENKEKATIDIEFYIYITIRFANFKMLSEDSYFYESLKNEKGIVSYLENNFLEIKDKLSKIRIEFNSLVDFDSKNEQMMELIYNNNMFSLDMKHISSLCESKNINLEENKILESLYYNKINGRNNKIYNKLIDNLSEILKNIKNLNIRQKSSKKFIIEFLKKNKLNDKDFLSLLDVDDIIFDDLSILDDRYYKIIEQTKKFKPTWKNINIIFKKDNFLSENMQSYILNNLEVLSKDTFNMELYSNLLKEMKKKFNIENKKSIYSLYESVINYIDVKTFETFSKENKKRIVNNKNVICKSEVDFNKVLEDIDLNDDEKTKIMILSCDYYSNFNSNKDLLNKKIMGNVISTVELEKQKICEFFFANKSIDKYENFFNKICDIALIYKIELAEDNILYLLKDENIDVEKKIKIFNEYIDYLEKSEEFSLNNTLCQMGSVFEKIANKDNVKNFEKNPNTAKFLNKLKKDGIITKYETHKSKYRIIY